MPEYRQVDRTQNVPPGTGIEGFLRTLRVLLKLPRLQSLHIDARGRISYSYFAPKEEEDKGLQLNFEDLTPLEIMRNSKITQLTKVSPHAATAVAQLFDMAAADHLHPVAFVTGSKSQFWAWFEESTHLNKRDTLFGLPVQVDERVPDDALILGAAYGPGGELFEAHQFYKLSVVEATQ